MHQICETSMIRHSANHAFSALGGWRACRDGEGGYTPLGVPPPLQAMIRRRRHSPYRGVADGGCSTVTMLTFPTSNPKDTTMTTTTLIDPALTALRQQARRLIKARGRRRPVYPADLELPPGRRVYAQIASRRCPYLKQIGYRPGELLRWDTLWLDRPPYRPEADRGWGFDYIPEIGECTWGSGTTDFQRVR